MAGPNNRVDQPSRRVIGSVVQVHTANRVVEDVFVEQEAESHVVGFLSVSRYSVSSSRP
jgi:hypothetical protein